MKVFYFWKWSNGPVKWVAHLKCWDTYPWISSLPDFLDFPTNFHRHKNIFILDRFEKFYMFWKATSLSRSFLHSTSCGVMFWYPLGTHLSRKYPSRFSVQFLTVFWSVLEHCGPKLSPWGYPKWSDDKDIQGKRHFGTILGALKFSARSDKMSWKNLKFSTGAGTDAVPAPVLLHSIYDL